MPKVKTTRSKPLLDSRAHRIKAATPTAAELRQCIANIASPHARVAIQQMQSLATDKSRLTINTLLECSPAAWMAVSERAAQDDISLDAAASRIIEDSFRQLQPLIL